MPREMSEDERKRTIWLWGKPYHWELNLEQRLSLHPGPTEHEKIRWEVVKQLIEKGVPEDKITSEMIDKVIEQAEAAAIMEAVSGE